MPLAMWAKTAAGTNLTFVKGLGKAVKTWRDVLQQTVLRKVAPKTKVDLKSIEAREKCLINQPLQYNNTKNLQSRLLSSILARTFSRSWASELRRRSALMLSSSSLRNFRNVPLMSLIGVTLGFDVSTVVDDSADKIMAEMREKFRSYTWQVEPLEKMPQSLNDLDINPKSIANGCEGAVYEAKIKLDSVESPVSVKDNTSQGGGTDYDLAVKAVFNYEAESNSSSIIRALEREIVPLNSSSECLLDSFVPNKNVHLPPHPNIIEMPGMFVDDMLVTEEGLQKFPAAMPHRLNPEMYYGRNKTLYLVMKRRNTHLRDYLSNHDITMETRCLMLAQLLEGVNHLGQNGVAHRDLKSDNILVDVPSNEGAPRLEICDFGCCLAQENKSLMVPFPSADMYRGGNSWLMAPEITTATPGPDSFLDFSKSDLWAAGTVAYEILGGENPFYPSKHSSRKQLNSARYCEDDLPPLPDLGGVPLAVKRLVKSLLQRDPKKRPTASVAATVAQMVVLEGHSAHEPKSRSRHSNGRRPVSMQRYLRKEKEKFYWVMTQSLTMLCRLVFSNKIDKWDMKSVMSFLLLSRLNYADFREAFKFFLVI